MSVLRRCATLACRNGAATTNNPTITSQRLNKDWQMAMQLRLAATTPSGAILPEPKRIRFGFLAVISSVITGILIGATISKMMANFLEENDLFVPSDDDDDDDD